MKVMRSWQLVARPYSLDDLAGELCGIAGQGKQGAGLATALLERGIVSAVL